MSNAKVRHRRRRRASTGRLWTWHSEFKRHEGDYKIRRYSGRDSRELAGFLKKYVP